MALNLTALRAARDSLGIRLNEVFTSRVKRTVLEKEIVKSVPAGAPGQIPFVSIDGTRFSASDYLLRKGAFVNSSAEVTAAKSVIVDNGTVFNTWLRFSHLAADETQPALPAEITTWAYDSGTDSLNNTTNSVSLIGVVSTKKYSNYVLEARLSSTHNDDDLIGLVLAWFVDPVTGRQYSLIAHRSTGGTAPWAVTYNLSRSDSWMVVDGISKVKWGNGNFGATAAAAGYVSNQPLGGWDDFAVNGTKIKVTREGDVIKVVTTQLGVTTYDPTTELTIDLTSDPRLEKFRGPRAYGYCAWSQAASKWDVLSFSDTANIIYDLSTGQVWKYNIGSGTWVIDATSSIAKNIGNGRLLNNPTTGKTFFIAEDGVVHVLSDI